jgi:transcriptional antiterminator RfaH
MAFWACAQIVTNETARVVWRVERQGFTLYLPLCRPSPRSLRIAPLFPGYCFIQIENVWRCLLSAAGIINVIRSGEGPAVVRDSEIEQIRRQENRQGVIVLPLTKFQPGEKVRVTRGPMVDRRGIYASMSARDRIKVLFSMFEREVTIEVREADVISA